MIKQGRELITTGYGVKLRLEEQRSNGCVPVWGDIRHLCPSDRSPSAFPLLIAADWEVAIQRI